MIASINNFTKQLLSINPWTRTIGVARSLLALSSLLTLLFNSRNILFHPGSGIEHVPTCIGMSSLSIFCLFNSNLLLAKWIAILILAFVIGGLYPRVTCILHWWVAFSINSTLITVDGGDQVNAVFTLLFIPVCITDTRKSHWQVANKKQTSSSLPVIAGLFAVAFLFLIKVQVSLLYFHAAVSKFKVAEWSNGTALFYWINDPLIGAPGWIKPFLNIVLSSPFFIVLFTWGALLIELLLCAGIFLRSQTIKNRIFLLGLFFHVLIGIFFGIVTFAISMTAVLYIYLMPSYNFKKIITTAIRWKPFAGLAQSKQQRLKPIPNNQ